MSRHRARTRRRFAGALVVAAVSAVTPALRATEAAPSCAIGEGRALSELACELAAGLGPVEGARVRAATSAWDLGASRGSALEARLVQELERTLAPGRPRDGAPRTVNDESPRVDVTAFTRGGVVHAEARTRVKRIGFWDRLRGLRGPAPQSSRSTRFVDGEVRALLPPAPISTTQVVKIPHAMPDVVAVACGDPDGDETLDVLLVGRRKLALGPLDAARFAASREVAWSTLATVSPAPLREPVARAEMVGSALRVGSTDRDAPVVLSPSLAVLGRLTGALPLGSAGCLARGGTALESLAPCTAAKPAAATSIGTVDAAALGIAVSATGAVHSVVALRASTDGSVTLRDAEGRTARIASTGAALAVADLDLDGVVDVVSSENTLARDADALVVRAWTPGSDPVERRRLAVPEGIRAVAVCPPDAARRIAVVVATPSSLWVLR